MDEHDGAAGDTIDALRSEVASLKGRLDAAEHERYRYMERFDKSERQRLEAEARSSRARGLLGEARVFLVVGDCKAEVDLSRRIDEFLGEEP